MWRFQKNIKPGHMKIRNSHWTWLKHVKTCENDLFDLTFCGSFQDGSSMPFWHRRSKDPGTPPVKPVIAPHWDVAVGVHVASVSVDKTGSCKLAAEALVMGTTKNQPLTYPQTRTSLGWWLNNHMGHFCATNCLNTLVHFSLLLYQCIVDYGMQKRVECCLWSVQCGVWSVKCKV